MEKILDISKQQPRTFRTEYDRYADSKKIEEKSALQSLYLYLLVTPRYKYQYSNPQILLDRNARGKSV